MRTLVAAALAVLAPLAAVATPAPAGGIDFGALATRYLAAHPVTGKAGAEPTLAELIDAHYALVEVGALDVRIPREFLADKAALGRFAATITAVLDAHRAWLDWVGAPAEAVTQAKADIAEVQKLLKDARLVAGGEKERDFLAALDKGAAARPALERLRDGFRSGKTLGFAPRGEGTQCLLLAPTRKNFVELAGVLGHFDEPSRTLYWNDGLVSWTEFAWNQTQIVALQYPAPKAADFGEGVDMDGREATGLLQHVAQRAAVTLCWHCFGTTLDPAFEIALAQALVIELYGQNNTRSGGTGRPNSVDGLAGFVPGGNSNGGALPQMNAESSWRNSLGADWFLKVLRESQKDGAKGAAKSRKGSGPKGEGGAANDKVEKIAWFDLHSDDTTQHAPVRAPFLGSGARDKPRPPREFMTDYLEFFRAYKTAFVHWLREKSQPKPADGKAKLAALLVKAAEAGGAASFEELVVEVYGVPFSDADLSRESLELAFLRWLSGAK